MQSRVTRFLRFATLGLAALLAGCSTPPRLSAVPVERQDDVVVLGDPAHRSWDEAFNEAFIKELMRSVELERAALRAAGRSGSLPPAEFLAISGGGQNGAFGAGILCGWTVEGSRPEFKAVTGISTGALTAPFAFLGPDYDDELREVYTTISTKDIARKRGMLAAIYNDAMADNAPLRRLMEKYIDEEMLRKIAREHARGRLLLIGTTNLDAGRGVIWNIGAIASSGDPGALELVRDVLIASAAIPGAFPPVMIDVEVNGEEYQEMHVDGGARAQLFLYPPSLRLGEFGDAQGIDRDRIAYVIRNARLDSQWNSIERRTMSIAGRAVSMMIQTQGIGDLYRVFLETKRDGVAFNLAYIPPSFTEQPTEDFDPAYMSRLFNVGYELAVQQGGYPWKTDVEGLGE